MGGEFEGEEGGEAVGTGRRGEVTSLPNPNSSAASSGGPSPRTVKLLVLRDLDALGHGGVRRPTLPQKPA